MVVSVKDLVVRLPLVNRNAYRFRLSRLPIKPKRSRVTICSGPPPVASSFHTHGYGYQEPYGFIYKCGINGCTSPVELVVLSN